MPDNLIKQWLGHSQNLMDLYAAQLQYDVAYRREWCETAGLGFELGESGTNAWHQFARHSLRKPILRQASNDRGRQAGLPASPYSSFEEFD